MARKAGSPPPGSPATSTRSTLDAAQVEPVRAHSSTYAAYEGVSTTASGRSRSIAREEPLGVARADRDVRRARSARSRRAPPRRRTGRRCRWRRSAARLDAGRGVAARRARDPVLEVAGGQRDVARRAGRAAGRVDADDLVAADAEVRADRVLVGRRRLQLGLLGQRQPGDVGRGSTGRPRRASRGRTASARAGTRAARGSAASSIASCSAQGRVSTSGSRITSAVVLDRVLGARARAAARPGASRSSARCASRPGRAREDRHRLDRVRA